MCARLNCSASTLGEGGDSREWSVALSVARTARQSQRLKKDFLAHFRVYGNVTAASNHVGVVRSSVYRWQEHDEQFAAAYREAEIEATEVLEAEARRRAVDGVVSRRNIYDRQGRVVGVEEEIKYSDTLLIFILKARAPEKYRERVQMQHADAEGGRIDLATLMQRAREYRDAEQPA